jgi:uncharacterized protein involved in exopolysaccharide biosynthesis
MGQIQNVEDLLNFLIRRRWLIILVAALGILVSAIYAKSRPDIYEAAAVIQVQGAQVGTDATAGGSAQVLQSIEQRLTTREALLKVIERHGLYADLPALSDEEKAALLRASISFEGVATAGNQAYGQPAQLSAIIILARDGDPDKAARIANDFAQSVLDLSSSGQMARARDTLDFYREEETRLSGQVAALDAGIADFKKANADALPEEADARRDEIAALDADLRGLDQDLVALMEEQRQLAARGDLRATEQRRLQELDGQIAVLTEQKSALTDRRTALQAALARLPEVERVLSGLERQLDQAQGSLDAVIAKLGEAETALRLAERQQGERLALLDRAVTPEHPTGSGGKKLFLAGAMASVLGALALAFLLDLMKPVVRTSAQMERQLGLRPVIALPELDLPARRRRGGGPGIADMRQKLLALPRLVIAATGLTLILMAAAALS